MKTKYRVVSITTICVFALALLAPVAYADSFKNLKRLGHGLEKVGRSATSGKHGGELASAAGQLLGGSKGRNAVLGQALLGNLGGSRHHGGGNWAPLAGALLDHGRYGGYGRGHGDWPGYGGYGSEDATARAIRDVGLANAMVNLVGVVATTATQPYPYGAPVYRAPVYGAPVYGAPAPMMQAPVAVPVPSGHYVREKVLVSGPHYEQTQEWVPELYDPRTGQKIGGGFYEPRTRLVPETYEYRDVLVTPNAGQW